LYLKQIAATEKTRYAAELEAYKISKAEESIAAEKELEEKVKLEKVHALQLFKQKEKTDQAKKVQYITSISISACFFL
jgi:acid phosphatase class B